MITVSFLVTSFLFSIHDRMDNRLIEDRQHNALKDQWAYDSLYRVVDQKRDIPQAGGNPGEERAWTLDGPGNWTALGISTFGKKPNTTTLTQSLNPLNSYTAFGGVAQADDLDGNRIDDGRFLYKWDFLHRLREVHCKTGGELIATYLCDAYGANGMLNGSGRRVRKIVSADKHGCSGTFEALKETDEMPGDSEDANDPGAEKSFAKRKASDIRYLYDGMACIEERNGVTDKVLRQYVNGARVNEHLTMDVYASDGVKLKGTLFYHEDAKGWIVALTDKTGKLKERVSYDAFGMPRFENAKGKASGNQTQSKFGNPYLYGGSYFDLETRLFLMGHRFYSPAEGRFVSRDPIGLYGDGINLGNGYGYVGGNAVNRWDPRGTGDADVHYGEVKYLAMKAGFSEKDAETIAVASDVADFNENRPKQFPGSLTKEGQERIAREHFPTNPGTTLVEPGSAAARAGIRNATRDTHTTGDELLQAFGEGMHPFVDSWYHQGQPSLGKLGHPTESGGTFSHHADWTYLRPQVAWGATVGIWEVLQEFLSKHPEFQTCHDGSYDPWNDPLMFEFTNARTKSEKINALTKMGITLTPDYQDDISLPRWRWMAPSSPDLDR